MKILLDTIQYTKKPSGKDIGMISRRITNNIYSTKNIYKIADLIGNRGHTWCPAIFNEKRSKDTFREIQLVALDFDGGISFDEVKTKAEKSSSFIGSISPLSDILGSGDVVILRKC